MRNCVPKVLTDDWAKKANIDSSSAQGLTQDPAEQKDLAQSSNQAPGNIIPVALQKQFVEYLKSNKDKYPTIFNRKRERNDGANKKLSELKGADKAQ